MSYVMQKLRENRYRSNHVEWPIIYGTPRRILKGIRKFPHQQQPSTQLDSTTLFRNFSPSTEIKKSSTLNCESTANLICGKKYPIREYDYRIAARYPCKYFAHGDKFRLDYADLEYGKKCPISEKYPFQANRYRSNHVELSNIYGTPRRIIKGIRNLHRIPQPSTQLDSTTLSRNISPSTEIDKSSTLSCESIAHLSEIQQNYILHNIQLYSSKACTDDVDLEYSKKYPISEYDYRIAPRHPCRSFAPRHLCRSFAPRHPCRSFAHEDKFCFLEQDLVSPDSIKISCVLNCENSPTNHQFPPQIIPEQFKHDTDEKAEIYDESNINECRRTNFNHKTLPTEVCVSPQGVCETSVSLYDEIQNSKKDLNSFEKTTEPISYTCESTLPEEFKHDTEFSLNTENISSTFYPDTDEKVEIYDKSNVNECRRTNFNDKILPTEVCEAPQGVCDTTVSLYDDIHIRKKIHNKPISYTWKSTSEGFKRDTELVFDMGHSSTFCFDTDEKVEIYDKSYINDCRRANFNHNILPTEFRESPQGVSETSVSLYEEIQNSKKVRDGLEKTTVLFINELFLLDADGVGCLSMPESLEVDFNKKNLLNSFVNNSFKKGELISSHGSQDIHYPELETNKPMSSTWEGLKRDKEFVFDMEHNFISDPPTDGKLEIYDKSAIKEYRGIHFTNNILQTEVYEGSLKNSYVQNLYVLISLDNSQGIQYPELKMNSLAKSLGIPRFIEEKSYESLKHFANIDERNEVLYQATALLDNQKENINDELCIVTNSERSDSVDFNCQFRNEYEENKELFTLPSESTLLLLNNLLFHLQNTYEIVQREVYSWLLKSGSYQSDYEIQNFENDSSCESVRALKDDNYFEKKGLISLGIQDSEPEMNKLAKFLCNEKSTFTQENSYKSLKHLTNIDESNEEYYLSLIDNLRNTFNDKTNLATRTEQNDFVDFYCKLSTFQNESEENKNLLILRYESTFLLLDNILFRLQNTYQNVEKEVQSWLLNSATTDHRDSKIHETSCESVTTLTDENGCSTNSNYLMRFKGRNFNKNFRKYYECGWPSSDTDTLSPSEGIEPQSDLDDSESSLEGSFKQLRPDSRASTISSSGDSNDFDDIPRFSLPPLRKSNEQKFYTKRTELFDEVSSKEWSWKNSETEISWKCTRKRRSFRSEEHCVHGANGIPRDDLPDDFGIPEELLRDFNVITLKSENATNVERATDTGKC